MKIHGNSRKFTDIHVLVIRCLNMTLSEKKPNLMCSTWVACQKVTIVTKLDTYASCISMSVGTMDTSNEGDTPGTQLIK